MQMLCYIFFIAPMNKCKLVLDSLAQNRKYNIAVSLSLLSLSVFTGIPLNSLIFCSLMGMSPVLLSVLVMCCIENPSVHLKPGCCIMQLMSETNDYIILKTALTSLQHLLPRTVGIGTQFSHSHMCKEKEKSFKIRNKHTCIHVMFLLLLLRKKEKNWTEFDLLFSCCLDGLLFSSYKLVICTQFHSTAECQQKISAYGNYVLTL